MFWDPGFKVTYALSARILLAKTSHVVLPRCNMAEKHSLGCAEEENENGNVSGLYITENCNVGQVEVPEKYK